MPRSRGNESPSNVLNESIIFFLHCLNPLGILEGLADIAWFSDSWTYVGETMFRDDGIFKAGLHGMVV